MSASGKTVLITCASSSIGQAIALAFARANAQTLILCGRHSGPLNATVVNIEDAKPGTGMLTIEADIGSKDQIENMFKRVKREAKRLDFVIDCTGYLKEDGSESDDVEKLSEEKTRPSLLLSRQFLNAFPPTLEDPKTLIVLSSSNPTHGLDVSTELYPGTELTEVKLVRQLAAENPSNFRAYSLTPGVPGISREQEEQGGTIVDENTATSNFAPEVPTQPRTPTSHHQATSPADLPAGFILWLCSGRSKSVPSGLHLCANWDVDELEAKQGDFKAIQSS